MSAVGASVWHRRAAQLCEVGGAALGWSCHGARDRGPAILPRLGQSPDLGLRRSHGNAVGRVRRGRTDSPVLLPAPRPAAVIVPAPQLEPADVDDDQELVLEELTREQVLDWRSRAAADHRQQRLHRAGCKVLRRARRAERSASLHRTVGGGAVSSFGQQGLEGLERTREPMDDRRFRSLPNGWVRQAW
jgi:hypothetical protein